MTSAVAAVRHHARMQTSRETVDGRTLLVALGAMPSPGPALQPWPVVPRAPWVRAEILLLSNEANLTELFVELLAGLTVDLVQEPAEAADRLRRAAYGLALVTNAGLSPWEAVAIVPARRRMPALFVSGWWDEELERTCRQKAIAYLPMPFTADAFLGQIRAMIGPSLGAPWGA